MGNDENDPEFDLVECAHCAGLFLREDMDGEHCRECADEIFGDDD